MVLKKKKKKMKFRKTGGWTLRDCYSPADGSGGSR